MSYFKKIAEGVPVAELREQLEAQPQLWNKNPARLSKNGPHYEISDIYIRGEDETRFIQGLVPWTQHGQPHIPVWFQSADYLTAAKPLVYHLSANTCAEMIGSVIIYRVRPGEKIHPHVDKGWHPEFFDKFNVCIASNEKAAFVYDDEQLFQTPGDVHWFRNDVTHSVINDGDTDHIVMVVCLRFDRGYRCPWTPEEVACQLRG